MAPFITARRRELDPARSFAEHHAFVRSRLRGLGVADPDLEDAAQDVFEVLVRRVADYDRRFPVQGWLAGIARRVARRYRERGHRVVLPFDEALSAAAGELDTPEATAAREQARRELAAFLEELEPERWEVFVLSEIEGLRGSEIAQELGLNQNTVYARLRSARTSFERRLARMRARERRRGWGFLPVWSGSPKRPWVVPVVGLIALGSILIVAANGAYCGLEPGVTQDSATPGDGAGSVSTAAPQGGVSVRSVDPAGLVPAPERHGRGAGAEQPDADGWFDAGTSSLRTMNQGNGEVYLLRKEQRYRFEGDRIIYEVTFVGDDDVDTEAARLDFAPQEGLDVVDGQLAWEVSLPAGGSRTVQTTFRATALGVVRLHADSGSLAFVNDGGTLRRCEDDECGPPIGDADDMLAGDTITVNVANDCEVAKKFVLFAGYPDRLPPPDVKLHTLEAGERTRMTIDPSQWFLNWTPDQQRGSGVRTDTDGAWVQFSGAGETCDTVSTHSSDEPGSE